MKYALSPLLLVVSNPADILTREVQEVSGLPAKRVIGSGTWIPEKRSKTTLTECKLHSTITLLKTGSEKRRRMVSIRCFSVFR